MMAPESLRLELDKRGPWAHAREGGADLPMYGMPTQSSSLSTPAPVVARRDVWRSIDRDADLPVQSSHPVAES